MSPLERVGRRVIPRPRLTALLDGASSHVIALVGPAGFGKTTLARQWLSLGRRESVWYRASEASVDVAELITGLAQTVDPKFGGVAARMSDRVRSAQRPQDHAERLAASIVDELSGWPTELWLVIDDYHFVMRAKPAEAIVRILSESGVVNLLVTSRERPAWATPRRLLYGEVYELSRSALALTAREALEVIGPQTRSDLPGLMALTEGWPAVIGLAALAGEIPDGPRARLPESLYDYLAEELFRAADEETQRGLGTLCLLTQLRGSDLVHLLGPNCDHVLARGEELGFLTKDREQGLDLHPLLRTFLREKLAENADQRRVADDVVSFLLDKERWDDAFALIDEYRFLRHFNTLIERGLYPLLDAGRVTTVERWIDASPSLNGDSPRVELMQAEVLFRHGNWIEAERAARSAAMNLEAASPLKARAFYRAGHSAQLSDNHDRALRYHKAARDSAISAEETSQALWGMFITQCELEQLNAAKGTLTEFNRVSTRRPEDELRSLSSAIVLARRLGGLREAVPSPRMVRYVVSRQADPIPKSGFLQALSTGLNLVARYEEALEIALLEIEDARANGLAFVLPHAFCNTAVAHLGLKNLRNALTFVEAARTGAAENADMHAKLNANAIEARILLSQGKTREAVEAVSLSAWSHQPTLAMGGDYLATRALALACTGDFTAAVRQAEEARRLSRDAEATVLAMAAIAIAGVAPGRARDGENTDHGPIRALLNEMHITGNRDSVVCAYRASPALLAAMAQIEDQKVAVRDLVRDAGDKSLARKYGIQSDDVGIESLTPRESEVLELVGSGMKNQEIARALWIAESTVKVHVRHIKQKLNARTRTELAARAAGS